jgi:hypothetical protein
MSAFWQALDWCAHHRLWTPAFLEFYGGTGGGGHDATCTSTSSGLPSLSVASLRPGWLPGWLAGSLAGGWLAAWLAGSLAGGCLAGSLPDWLAG